jgi:hypothetical protein
MLVAVERFTTGANAHDLRGLANAYVLACENDQPSIAEQYRTRLLGELDRSVRGRAAARPATGLRWLPARKPCLR